MMDFNKLDEILRNGNIDKVNETLKKAVINGDLIFNFEDVGNSAENIWSIIGLQLVNENRIDDAIKTFRKCIETMKEMELKRADKKEYHKGTPLHNWGVALLKRGDYEGAKKKFQEAYSEDRKNHPEEADSWPAKRMLDQIQNYERTLARERVSESAMKNISGAVSVLTGTGASNINFFGDVHINQESENKESLTSRILTKTNVIIGIVVSVIAIISYIGGLVS
jgi:tetratricopeptide (TPR) repeat protein